MTFSFIAYMPGYTEFVFRNIKYIAFSIISITKVAQELKLFPMEDLSILRTIVADVLAPCHVVLPEYQ